MPLTTVHPASQDNIRLTERARGGFKWRETACAHDGFLSITQCSSSSSLRPWTRPVQRHIISSPLPHFHFILLTFSICTLILNACLYVFVGGKRTLDVKSTFLTKIEGYSIVLLTIYTLLHSKALERFHHVWLKLYTHWTATSHFLLPPVLGNRHSTFCFYEFHYFGDLM